MYTYDILNNELNIEKSTTFSRAQMKIKVVADDNVAYANVQYKECIFFLFLPLTEHRKLKIAFKIGNGQMPSSRIFSIIHIFRRASVVASKTCVCVWIDGWLGTLRLWRRCSEGAYAFIFIIHFSSCVPARLSY